jgi:secreted Zn-dependent insulinase-like peptidase
VIEECKALLETQFQFLDQSAAHAAVLGLARALSKYPPEHALDFHYALDTWDPGKSEPGQPLLPYQSTMRWAEAITALLENIIPERMRLVVVSKSFQGKTTLREREEARPARVCRQSRSFTQPANRLLRNRVQPEAPGSHVAGGAVAPALHGLPAERSHIPRGGCCRGA